MGSGPDAEWDQDQGVGEGQEGTKLVGGFSDHTHGPQHGDDPSSLCG